MISILLLEAAPVILIILVVVDLILLLTASWTALAWTGMVTLGFFGWCIYEVWQSKRPKR